MRRRFGNSIVGRLVRYQDRRPWGSPRDQSGGGNRWQQMTTKAMPNRTRQEGRRREAGKVVEDHDRGGPLKKKEKADRWGADVEWRG